eukprot:6068698-Pyramimonas_sp.AAC.1
MLAVQHQCQRCPNFHVWMKLSTSVPVREAVHLVAARSAFDAEAAVSDLTDAAQEQYCELVYGYSAACAKAQVEDSASTRI